MNKFIYIILILSVISTSCDSFLDKAPSKSSNLPLNKYEQLDAILGNFYNFWQESNPNSIVGTEDWNISTDFYNSYNGSLAKAMDPVFVGTWDVKYTPYADKDGFWGKEYNKIFYANLVMDNIGSVEGGTKEQKANLKAEAHLIKAYSYYLLANTYCLPYNEKNKNELGLVLKNTTSFEESMKRVSLQETYEEIEYNLQEALKITNTLVTEGKFRPWRGNISAVKAFAARYYLSINEYSKAQKYAEEALEEYSELVDYNTEMEYYTTNFDDLEVAYPATYRASYTEQLSHKEFYYSRHAYYAYGYYVPSQELLAMYDQESDLRFRYHIVENYSSSLDDNSRCPGYVFYGMYNLPAGPTTSEMILIVAECQARTGEWKKGMQTLEKLRIKRHDVNLYQELSVATQEDAVKAIIKERRLEKPFVMTWYDYRRYNNNETDYDDVSLSREFYPYTNSSISKTEDLVTYELKKGDRRWARPIPNTEIESSQDVIEQNTY